ncbi:unnamed protein product [Nezara viridula]|uniref:Uncharacterized protein n=1 Tax=Nezara viridula TaxID=85310 RepID=A0A9P0H0F4_NEZVI|nr:unnamed protein product [Nezara viridula]
MMTSLAETTGELRFAIRRFMILAKTILVTFQTANECYAIFYGDVAKIKTVRQIMLFRTDNIVVDFGIWLSEELEKVILCAWGNCWNFCYVGFQYVENSKFCTLVIHDLEIVSAGTKF